MHAAHHAARNLRLLAQSAWQHLVDDPALLVVQISRRLPFGARVRAGRAVRAVAARIPAASGVEALGAYMAGDEHGAERIIETADGRGARLRGEVAILVDRLDLVNVGAAPRTLARSLWASGAMSEAVRVLESAGLAASAYGRRLRSELDLLRPGTRLPEPAPTGATELAPAAPAADESLRVLHLITNSLPHTQSGYSLRTHRVLRALAEHGIESVALTRTGYPVMVGKVFAQREDVIDSIRYRRTLPSRLALTPAGRLQQEVAEALEIVREFRPHVLHATTDYRNALVAQAVSATTGIPWVLEVRGLMEQTWIASHREERMRAIARDSEKVRLVAAREAELASSADAVVTLSRTMAEELEARGVPGERITLVPNGVDASLFEDHVTPTEARRMLGLDLAAEAFVVGAASALVDYEGFDVLLRAAAMIVHGQDAPSELRENLHVLLAGDGTAKPALVRLAGELGIGDRLIAPGRVPREQARRWVEACDVVVVPRLDREVTRTVTPQKPIEAMALGRPVICSDLPAMRETVAGEGEASAGLLVPPGDHAALADALTHCHRDPVQRVQQAADGRSAAGRRTWPAMMERFDAVYRTVLSVRTKETSSGE